MGITVEGQKCPVCGGYVFDNDDLVFCPTCGAPHHRDCYEAVGHCALEADHGTENQYKKPQPKDDTFNPTQDKKENANKAPKRRCVFCGEIYDINQSACPKCGTTAPVNMPFSVNMGRFDPLGGVGEKEKIEDAEAKTIASFVAVNTQRYLPKFKKLNKNNKLSWNWAAFLFPHAWFFFRKMYLQGVLFTILTLAAGLLSSSLNILLADFPEEALKSYPLIASYIIENFATLNHLPIYAALVGGLISLVISVVAGMWGDWWYRSFTLSSVKQIVAEENEDIVLSLRQKGGVNILLSAIALFATDWIVTFIYLLL